MAKQTFCRHKNINFVLFINFFFLGGGWGGGGFVKLTC